MDSLTIGKVAREAGVNVETVRYYERRGLVEHRHLTSVDSRLHSDGNEE